MYSQEFWNTFPLEHGQKEFFKQVGKTVQGKPISAEQFQRILSDIESYLGLDGQDDVLDLCCGNGLVTQEIAKLCRSIVGIDFSEPLIETARQNHQPSNARYLHRSVLGLSPENATPQESEVDFPQSGRYSKFYMYEALQHFKPEDLEPLLKSLLRISSEEVVVLLASVPDKSRIWDFYNTPERRSDYEERVRLGSDSMGTWWDGAFVTSVAKDVGLNCEIKQQDSILHTSHYRFDLVFRK